MMASDEANHGDRREFLRRLMPVGCLACLVQPSPILAQIGEAKADRPDAGGPESDSHWTYRHIFRFAYQEWLIPHLKNLAAQLGREQLLEALRSSSLQLGETHGKAAGQLTFPEFVELVKRVLEEVEVYKHGLTMDRFEVSKDVLEIRYTNCLWADTFREAGASDLGYAAACYQDFGFVRGLGGQVKLERPTTLMEGEETCLFRWVMAT